jgi:hypothetical protein
MNATEKHPDHDAINAEYDRLKPLRDLEKLIQEKSLIPSWRSLFAMIMLTVVMVMQSEPLFRPGSFIMTHHMAIPVLFAGVGLIAFLWADYARSASRARWTAVAQTLRTLAQEVNDLRSAKK